MELTASAFNVLLEMTTISNERVQPLSTPSLASVKNQNHKVYRADPILHYSNGHTSRIVSSKELIKIICSAPQDKHLVWTKGYKAWRSWKDIKSLRQAVKSNVMLKQKLPHSKTKTTRDTHLSPTTQTSKETRKSVSQQPQVKHSFNYLSVPATVFTQFDVDLTSIESATPFVGLDQSLQSGGLFLPTDRVLNIGDYLQVTVRIRGRSLLQFEAPILWLRTRQKGTNLQHGVAVAWPKLTTQQVRLIKKVTSTEHYEFFVA